MHLSEEMVVMVEMECRDHLVLLEEMDYLEPRERKETLVLQVLQVLVGLSTHDGEGSLAPIPQEHNFSIMEELARHRIAIKEVVAITSACQMTLTTPLSKMVYVVIHTFSEWNTNFHFQVVAMITMSRVPFVMSQHELQC